MDVEFKTLSLQAVATAATDALIVLLPDQANPPSSGAGAASALVEWVQKLQTSGELGEGVGACAQSVLGSQVVAGRLVLVRVGDGLAPSVKKALAAAWTSLKLPHIKKVTVFMGWLPQVSNAVLQAAALAVADASYQYTTTVSKAKPRALKQLVLAHTEPLPQATRTQRLLNAWIAGVELAKEWANRPANHATPTALAEAAMELSRYPGVSVEVLGPKDVAKLKMGAFMAVAQGSEQPLRFIVIRYQGAAKTQQPLVLIGKGITFDTGGISLKPAPEMDEMKFDMSGAASVLGTLRAVAELQPQVNVVALIPACENMPDGRAVKPGDVVTSMSGQTVEILNTDAEGRLILCDALTYAERFKPRSIVDVATLTGACVIALGHLRTGLFCNDDALAHRLEAAATQAHDPCWRMPLDDDYAEGLKTSFADVANVAGRAAGSVTAAKFLQRFVGQTPWAHLDIAGTAWKSGTLKGATGRPVGLLLNHVLQEAEAQNPPSKKTVSSNVQEPAGAQPTKAAASKSTVPRKGKKG